MATYFTQKINENADLLSVESYQVYYNKRQVIPWEKYFCEIINSEPFLTKFQILIKYTIFIGYFIIQFTVIGLLIYFTELCFSLGNSNEFEKAFFMLLCVILTFYTKASIIRASAFLIIMILSSLIFPNIFRKNIDKIRDIFIFAVINIALYDNLFNYFRFLFLTKFYSKLYKTFIDISLIKEKQNSNKKCVYCKKYDSSEFIQTFCGHIFHKKCLKKLLNSLEFCPECIHSHNLMFFQNSNTLLDPAAKAIYYIDINNTSVICKNSNNLFIIKGKEKILFKIQFGHNNKLEEFYNLNEIPYKEIQAEYLEFKNQIYFLQNYANNFAIRYDTIKNKWNLIPKFLDVTENTNVNIKTKFCISSNYLYKFKHENNKVVSVFCSDFLDEESGLKFLFNFECNFENYEYFAIGNHQILCINIIENAPNFLNAILINLLDKNTSQISRIEYEIQENLLNIPQKGLIQSNNSSEIFLYMPGMKKLFKLNRNSNYCLK